jgi:hypothetical protein
MTGAQASSLAGVRMLATETVALQSMQVPGNSFVPTAEYVRFHHGVL